MRIQQTELYTFEELSPEAQEKALEANWDWNVSDSYWYESAYEGIQTAGKLLGFTMDPKRFAFDLDRGSYFAFDGSYSYAKGAAKAVEAEFPEDKELHRIAAELQKAQRPYFYKLEARLSTGRGFQRVAVFLDNWEVENDAAYEAIRDFTEWALGWLRREYEYQTSDEAIRESLIANECEFTKEGGRP